MPPMPVEDTLERVAADLAADRTGLARQRLRGLVASFPHRLDVRERLAELYRRDGDPVQAGRWSWLAADRDDTEVAAFEAAYADPFARMRALRWSGAEAAAGPVAAARLRALREDAERSAGAPVSWDSPRREPARPAAGSRLVDAGCLGTLALVLALAGVGRRVVELLRG
jgi:hypothetical protein